MIDLRKEKYSLWFSELRDRVTAYERNHNICRFIFSTPFTADGSPHGDLAEQYKRKTILTTVNHFPYIKTRIQVGRKWRRHHYHKTYLTEYLCSGCTAEADRLNPDRSGNRGHSDESGQAGRRHEGEWPQDITDGTAGLHRNHSQPGTHRDSQSFPEVSGISTIISRHTVIFIIYQRSVWRKSSFQARKQAEVVFQRTLEEVWRRSEEKQAVHKEGPRGLSEPAGEELPPVYGVSQASHTASRTSSQPEQWREVTKWWLRYLSAGLIIKHSSLHSVSFHHKLCSYI